MFNLLRTTISPIDPFIMSRLAEEWVNILDNCSYLYLTLTYATHLPQTVSKQLQNGNIFETLSNTKLSTEYFCYPPPDQKQKYTQMNPIKCQMNSYTFEEDTSFPNFTCIFILLQRPIKILLIHHSLLFRPFHWSEIDILHQQKLTKSRHKLKKCGIFLLLCPLFGGSIVKTLISLILTQMQT